MKAPTCAWSSSTALGGIAGVSQMPALEDGCDWLQPDGARAAGRSRAGTRTPRRSRRAAGSRGARASGRRPPRARARGRRRPPRRPLPARRGGGRGSTARASGGRGPRRPTTRAVARARVAGVRGERGLGAASPARKCSTALEARRPAAAGTSGTAWQAPLRELVDRAAVEVVDECIGVAVERVHAAAGAACASAPARRAPQLVERGTPERVPAAVGGRLEGAGAPGPTRPSAVQPGRSRRRCAGAPAGHHTIRR